MHCRNYFVCTVFAVLFLLSNVSTAHAALSLTSGSSATTTPNIATSITGFQVTGPSASTTPVKLYTTSGTLSMSHTSGLTFDGASSGSVVYFNGTVADINAALATLTYMRSSTGTDTLEVSLVNKGEVFFPDNGHLYKFISGSYSWSAAKSAAESLTAYGASGYLGTITSGSENGFVSARLTGDGWIGSSDASTEGDWKWVTGPEAGTSFWSGDGNGSTVGGNYANWNTGEPNDSGSDEDCGETYVASGEWNDLNCTSNSLGYVVEFGASGDEPKIVAKNISIVTADVPAVTSLSPKNGDTNASTSAALTLDFSKTVSVGTGTISVKKVSDDSLVASIPVTSSAVSGSGSNTIVVAHTVFNENTQYYVLVPNTAFKDSSGNYFNGISTSATWQFTTGDFTAPNISNLSASSSSSTATIGWDTSEAATSQLVYGLTTATQATTSITDTAPHVTTHRVSLSGLLACTTYTYAAVSADASDNTATSTNATFTTSGCQSDTAPSSATSSHITSSVGGTVSHSSGSNTLDVQAPANFTSTSTTVDIQVQAIAGASVRDQLGKPAALEGIGSVVFEVKAVINGSTVLDSFDAPVTITYHYTDADIEGIDESTLWLYHYHDGSWQKLNDCSVNNNANTITCTTPSFSIFSVFGQQAHTTTHDSGGGIIYGCNDPQALNYNFFSASKPELCEYTSTSTSVSVSSLQDTLHTLIIQNRDLFLRAQQQGIDLPPFIIEALDATSTVIHSTVTIVPERDLYLGLEGSDVAALQHMLIAANDGPSARELARVGATGYFGVYTENALSEYQMHNGINPPNGYYGPITRTFASYQKKKE